MIFELLCMPADTAAHEPLPWTCARSVLYELHTYTFGVASEQQSPLLLVWILAREPIADVGIIEPI